MNKPGKTDSIRRICRCQTRSKKVTVAQNGDLEVTWNGYPTSLYHSGWLRHVHEGNHAHSAHIPSVQTWTVSTLPELPTYNGPLVLEDDEALREWLTAIVGLGIARLEGLGTGEDVVAKVGLRIGALRDTNFGATWSVSVDLDPGSVANTALPLAPHADLPTRENATRLSASALSSERLHGGTEST